VKPGGVARGWDREFESALLQERVNELSVPQSSKTPTLGECSFELHHERCHDCAHHVALDRGGDGFAVAIRIIRELCFEFTRRHRTPVGDRIQILFPRKCDYPVYPDVMPRLEKQSFTA